MAFYNERGEKIIAIFQDGVLISADPAFINFTGAVTVTPDGDGVDVNIGTSGGANVVFGEVVSGSGTSFTLAHSPNGTISLSANGQILKLSVDYTISGANITTISTWPSGSVIADYKY